jgi:RNA 3'-terminal phosphate cyclase
MSRENSEIVKRALAANGAGPRGGGEIFINPTPPRRVMEYPYVLAEGLNISSIDGIVIRLNIPYALTSRWRRLVRKVLRMDRIDTNATYAW